MFPVTATVKPVTTEPFLRPVATVALVSDRGLPEGALLAVRRESPVVADVPAAVAATLEVLDVAGRIRPGDTVALTGGSRGIADVVPALRTVVERVRALGATPFLVPAMGSHGGATAEGQRAVLAGYGMTPEALGCEVRASMDTVDLGPSPRGLPVLTDRLAHEADHLLVVNRVKPHTMFSGPVESGIAKMLAIGLGKHRGAAAVHRAVADHGWDAVLVDVVPLLAARGHLLGGVALVEGHDDRTALVAPVAADRVLVDEPALLAAARRWMPRLPFPEVDVLLVDRIGKDISGAGLDTNVVGRKEHLGVRGPSEVRVRVVAVRDLSPGTHGNALGIGLADLCRQRVLDAADWAATRTNALTAGHPEAAKAPIALATDAELLDVALPLVGLRAPADARVLWVRDSLHLDRVWASRALLDEATDREDLALAGPVEPLPWEASGDLPDLLPLP